VKLYRLQPEGARLVTKKLASGDLDRWEEDAWSQLVEELETHVPLEELGRAIDRIIDGTEPHQATIDAMAAPAIHAALPLTRRVAADPGVWRFLTVVFRPDFVRHRWENTAWATMRGRFWRTGTRPDSNAFSRLWWIAELTRDGDSYELTRRALQRQSLANALFVRKISFHRPAVEACIDVLYEASQETTERMLKGLTKWLGVVPLEGLEKDEVIEVLRALER